ncbi:MFS transporter [Aurantimicrobium minutum]|uniref:MFS transporter n=1 Tax=Aurantimicrobium minutum TaxID=708131 RepID=UPI002475506B|nr:MFS transporter [Aurantimicrobium minutum]MDH6240120.1 EmrB/QacA subfamily drug resistance transporter [Aurantimicrobium minutum]
MTSPRTRWFGLLFISLAVSLIIVDSTIINVSIPSIIEDLGITSTQVQWVQESYTLVFAALLLVFGALADRFGRRRVMVLGMAIFVVSSVIAGFSQSGDILIAARVLQGFGGAMVLPTTLSLVNATFQGKERGIAFAIWGSTIGGMVAVGPLLGGWLTTDYSWRWAFGINIPIGIIIIIGALLTVQESKEESASGSIDWLGAFYSVIAMSTLVFALIEGRTYGWWEVNKPFTVGDWTWPGKISIIPVLFLVFILASTLFIAHGANRIRKGKSALISFNLFTIASFRNGNIAAMVISLGEFGIILSLPLWLQFVIGYDALQTGFVLLGLAGGAFVASGLAGGLSGRVSPVTMVRMGILLEIVGVTGVGFAITPTASWVNVVPWLFVYGLGVGLATAQLTNVILKDVPVQESGQASGTQSTSRQLGSALGIAILGTILFTSVQIQLTNDLTSEGLPEEQVTQVVTAVVDSAGGAIVQLEADPTTQPVADNAKQALSDGTRYGAFAAAGFLVLGFLATLSLGSTRKEEVEQIKESDENHVI